jgi:3-methyladenine DNA glycosylase AlkD
VTTNPFDAIRIIDDLDSRLRAAGTPERAAQEKAYLHSDLTHYGTSVPDVRNAVRTTLRGLTDLDHSELIELVLLLWDQPEGVPVHERRAAAAMLLTERSSLTGLDDAPLWERLIRQSRTWALVDVLAGDAVGPALESLGEAATPLLDRWAVDDDFGLRRSALLVHLRALRVGDGDWVRFTRYADAMLAEREFFIRKAIGWILRDTARRRPGIVFEWVLPRADRMSEVTLREAIRYLTPEQSATIRSRAQKSRESG